MAQDKIRKRGVNTLKARKRYGKSLDAKWKACNYSSDFRKLKRD